MYICVNITDPLKGSQGLSTSMAFVYTFPVKYNL